MKLFKNFFITIKTKGFVTAMLAIKNFFIILLVKFFSSSVLIKKKIFNYKMFLDPRDKGISRTLLLFGERELDHKIILEKVLKKNMKIFDIGANIGIYSLYSAIKNENKVYAFEPLSANYNNLLDRINLNKLNNCQAFCFAVSNKISLSHIGVKNMHEGVADNVVGSKGDYYHGCVEIHLDYLVGKKVLPQPDYIKIDVDGFEDRVYKGAMSTIQQAKSVLIEVDQKHEHIVSNIINLGLRLESKHRRNSEEYNYIFVK